MGYPKAELSILLTGDDEIAALNKTWRGKDKPTDVLSFSQLEGRPCPRPTRGAITLGDIVISVETARRQAPRFGNNLERELTRLLVHGILHLIGHDHVHGGIKARRMRLAEEGLLQMLHGAP